MAAKSRPLQFELPSLGSQYELAQWLEIPTWQLHWLTNPSHQNQKGSDADSKHYRSRWIRKRKTGWRLLEAPKDDLKTVQRKVLQGIVNQVLPHPLAFGFCKNRNIVDFVKPHFGQHVLLKLDLADFFPSITFGRVYGWFRKLGYTNHVSHTLALLTTVRTCDSLLSDKHPDGPIMPSRWSMLYGRRHLPQGAPTSPAIANNIAFGLDVRMAGLARSIGGVHYSRYADDLLLSGDKELARQAKRLTVVAGAIAIEEGFRLNFRKSQILRASQKQKAGGVVLNEKINFDRKEFDQLKATIHNCQTHGLTSQNRNKHPNFYQHLCGRVSWVEQLNPNRGRKLRIMLKKLDPES